MQPGASGPSPSRGRAFAWKEHLREGNLYHQPGGSGGAFLGAVRAITQAGANIHRVSYNKAVDTHMLFLDVEGEEAQLKAVEEALTRQGYLADGRSDARVILLSFTLPDHPGALLPVLEVIEDFHFNISYISSQGDGSGVQHFKMGLFTRDMRPCGHLLPGFRPVRGAGAGLRSVGKGHGQYSVLPGPLSRSWPSATT